MTTAVMKRQHLFRSLVLFLCCCGLFFWPVCTISSETGLSVLTTDADNYDHSIVIEVKDPHSLKSSCPTGVSPCLADGSLRVALDGEEALLAPGTVLLGKDDLIHRNSPSVTPWLGNSHLALVYSLCGI